MNIYIGEPKTITVSDMQGPAPDGFHIPLSTEWRAIYDAGVSLGAWSSSNGTNFSTYLKLPIAGDRGYRNLNLIGRGSYGYYWSSTPNNANSAYHLYFYSSYIGPQNNGFRSNGMSMRCVQDSPTIPTASWTTLYQGSGNAGIFHNPTDGLISLSSDGTTWYTLMDKNLGATTVYNYGDTMTEANCGKVYQRGNNYAFSGDENYDVSLIPQSSTQIDVTGYGPGNYYESSTWITTLPWQSSANDGNNLRGGVSQGTSTKSVEVKNIYIGEYKPIYRGEYIEYKMNANFNGYLYVPIDGCDANGSWASYSRKISVNGGTETTYTGTSSSGGKISLGGYTPNTEYTIKIVPTTESYQRARAYSWYNTNLGNYLTEIVYDASYMGYALSATNTGNEFRRQIYDGCYNITKPANEFLPETVTTIGERFRYNEYDGCTSLNYASEESLPNSVTSIGVDFRGYQYDNCTALTEIKGWKDLNIGNSTRYRQNQFDRCTSNKTVKVLSDVGYASYDSNTLQNAYVTSVSVPNQYLTNFKNSSNYPWVGIDDSKFVGY